MNPYFSREELIRRRQAMMHAALEAASQKDERFTLEDAAAFLFCFGMIAMLWIVENTDIINAIVRLLK